MVKLWTKKETQNVIKNLRQQGLDIRKVDTGFYKATVNSVDVFSAMTGMGGRGYIVRLHNDYFDLGE